MGAAIDMLRMRATATAGFAGSPYFVADGGISARGSSTAPLDVVYPAGVLVNDIAFLEVCSIDSTTAHTVDTPSGWNAVQQDKMNAVATNVHALFWKRLTGSESGNVRVTKSAGGTDATDTFEGVISLWRGCQNSGIPYEALAVNTGQSTGQAGSTVTTNGVNRTIVNFCVCDDDTLSAPAASWTEQFEYTTISGSSNGAIKAYSIEKPTAGSLSGVTHTLASSERWQVKSLVLLPNGSDAMGDSHGATCVFFIEPFTTVPTDEITRNFGVPAGNANVDTTNRWMQFDGTGDWYVVGGGVHLDIGTNWTIDLHIDGIQSTDVGALISRKASGVGRFALYCTGTSGTLQFYIDELNAGAAILSAASMLDGNPTHIRIVKSGTSYEMLKGGVSKNTATVAGSVTSVTDPLYIGVDIADTTNRAMNGKIGRVAMYSSALSSGTFTPPARSDP